MSMTLHRSSKLRKSSSCIPSFSSFFSNSLSGTLPSLSLGTEVKMSCSTATCSASSSSTCGKCSILLERRCRRQRHCCRHAAARQRRGRPERPRNLASDDGGPCVAHLTWSLAAASVGGTAAARRASERNKDRGNTTHGEQMKAGLCHAIDCDIAMQDCNSSSPVAAKAKKKSENNSWVNTTNTFAVYG